MNSSDVRLVRLIPTTGEGSFSRPSPKWVYDRTGTLVEVPADTLGLTYDPSDLSKAPYALVEPAMTNLLRYSEQLDVTSVWGGANLGVGVNPAVAPNGTLTADRLIAAAFSGAHYRDQQTSGPYTDGDVFTFSIFLRAHTLDKVRLTMYYAVGSTGGDAATFDLTKQVLESRDSELSSAGIEALPDGWCRCWITGVVRYASVDPTRLLSRAVLLKSSSVDSWLGTGDEGVFAWGAQLVAGDKPGSYIPTTNVPVTRAADEIGAGAGLVYSNVPITEPLWAAGTYALGAKVRDAQNFVFESQAAGNTAPLTDKTKWLPLGLTNRWKVFDKAVNSQTSAPGMLTFSVKPGGVATTLMLLNIEGASVTVSQSDSGYVQTRNLVRHEVDNWYDFYYEEPIREGDAVFTDIPPYPNSTLTVSIDNGPLESKIGACLIGKPFTLGKVTASFSAGVLSYSTSTTDTFGNITMVKRYNAPKMNFDVMIPAGAEDLAYRTLREYTDTEIGIIVGDRFSMGIGYGFLGQWDVPKSGSGRTAPIEFKGLV